MNENAKIKCMYADHKFKRKQNSNGVEIIITDLLHQHEIGLKKLAVNLGQGATFKPAYLSGTKNANWISSQLFAIDIDNKGDEFEKYGYMSSYEFIVLCEKYGIKPVFCYHTFSSTEENERFRAVFAIENEIIDIRFQKLIQFTLMKIFPQSDPQCKDSTRFYYGGKDLFYENYDSVVTPYQLISVLMTIFKEQDSKSFKRNIKKHCQEIGLNTINGFPDMQLLEEEDAHSPATLYVYNSPNGQRALIEGFNFSSDCDSNTELCSEQATDKKKYDITDIKVSNKLKDNYSFENLESKCQLYKKFTNGEYWPSHHEYFGLCTNICRYEGGAKRLIDALEYYEYTDSEKINKIITAKTAYIDYNYVSVK